MCKARMTNLGESAKERIFLEHIVKVLRWLKEKYPHLQLLMWDDMFRHIDPLLLLGTGEVNLPENLTNNLIFLEYELGKLVEPMVWHYRSSKTFQLSRGIN